MYMRISPACLTAGTIPVYLPILFCIENFVFNTQYNKGPRKSRGGIRGPLSQGLKEALGPEQGGGFDQGHGEAEVILAKGEGHPYELGQIEDGDVSACIALLAIEVELAEGADDAYDLGPMIPCSLK